MRESSYQPGFWTTIPSCHSRHRIAPGDACLTTTYQNHQVLVTDMAGIALAKVVLHRSCRSSRIRRAKMTTPILTSICVQRLQRSRFGVFPRTKPLRMTSALIIRHTRTSFFPLAAHARSRSCSKIWWYQGTPHLSTRSESNLSLATRSLNSCRPVSPCNAHAASSVWRFGNRRQNPLGGRQQPFPKSPKPAIPGAYVNILRVYKVSKSRCGTERRQHGDMNTIRGSNCDKRWVFHHWPTLPR